MKKSSLVIILLIVFFLIVTFTVDGKRERERDLQITSLNIQFEKTDAIFTVNYSFDKISKTFLLIFGSKTIEPKLKTVFRGFDYDIIKINQDMAMLRVKNISRLDKGFYLHDSHKFNVEIETVIITDPSNPKPKEYYNINATPNYFYKDLQEINESRNPNNRK